MSVYYYKNVYCPWSSKDIQKVFNLAARMEKSIKGDVEINIISEEEIKKMNSDWRGINKPTDVLSFAWQEEKRVPTKNLGQIYLCYSYIVKQAAVYHVSVEEEFARTLIHGILHLVGYDHQEKKAANKMFTLQQEIMNKYGA